MVSVNRMTELPRLSDLASEAVAALVDDAGSTPARAEAVVEAVASAAAHDALATTAGSEPVYGSIVDARLASLRRIIEQLGDRASPLSAYEAATVFRITPNQGRTLLRTYQARYAKDYRARMSKAVQKVAKGGRKKGAKPTRYDFAFEDAGTLEYAVERMRRHGFERSLTVDRVALVVSVDESMKVSGQDARDFLVADSK